MREYDDDNIRLYTPVLQRVIILTAVIIAVPVVMWTITTFVRSYVAQPKVPTFQRLAQNEPADDASNAAPAAAAPAAAAEPAPAAQMADAGATASDARTPLLRITKPADAPPPADASPPAATPAPQLATPAPQPAALQPAAPRPQPAPAPPASPPTAPSQPAVSPIMPAAASAGPAAAPSPMPTAVAKADGAAPAAADRGIVWPNPNTNAPPVVGTESAAMSAPKPAEPQATSDAETLPQAEPISGPIPLPRHRPNDVAMLQIPGVVPLPRARPVDAPAAPPAPAEAPAGSYDPGMGRY